MEKRRTITKKAQVGKSRQKLSSWRVFPSWDFRCNIKLKDLNHMEKMVIFYLSIHRVKVFSAILSKYSIYSPDFDNSKKQLTK